MIIWLNGPYGVGKSTLAEKVRERVSQCFLFDAELVGDAVRENFPEQFFKETYEEFPVWLEICRKLLKELDSKFDGCILVPMTLIRPDSVEAIVGGLKSDGVRILHVLLDASPETIWNRILTRGENEDCWCMQQIDRCLAEQQKMTCDLRLLTTNESPEILADLIVTQIND